MKRPLLLAGFLLVWGIIPAQPLKRLYLANDEHTDYMWTANEAQYDSAFVHMLDYYLDEIDATRSKPPDFQARFNCDGSFWLRTYEKYRSPAQFERLVAALRSGHISSPLNTLVSTYGAQPTEAVLRGMYYAGQMERRLNLRFPLALCMENQTLPLGLSSLWAGAGAKYSWRGVCACATRIPLKHFPHRKHPLYRYTGQDGSGVIMKWYNLPGDNKGLGGYAETRQHKTTDDPVAALAQTIEHLDQLCDVGSAQSTYPFNVAGAFGYGWDDLDTYVSPAFITAAEQGSTAERTVRVSNEVDFFEDVARSYPQLPVESLSHGNEWDTYCASMNETTAQVRRATEKLRAAEALASLVSLKNPNFDQSLKAARDAAWEAFGLYWEHDWTADGPVPQKERAEWQIRMQERISGYTDSLFHLSRRTLGRQLKPGPHPRFYVFNPLNWSRSDVADLPFEGDAPVKVIDLHTNKETASQRIVKQGKAYLRIQAENVPSVGYKVFEIQPGPPQDFPPAARFSGEYVQNAFYRIRLHRSGVISELYDSRANDRQLVKAASGKYLNDLGTENLDEGAPLLVENAGPVSLTLKAVSQHPIPHTVRLTLFANSPRIELEDSIQANFRDVKTWAFSFNLDAPTTRHEELGAILTAKKETRGGHYAAQNARYDWLTFNHFADLSQNGYGITLSNVDCSFFKLGNSTPDSLWETSSQLHALAGGQTDPWKDTLKLGVYGQFGQTDFLYQFALLPHAKAFDAVEAMRFSLEHQNPLVAGRVTGEDARNKQTAFSLLSTDSPEVLLWSVKPAEEGMENGLIARFWNLGDQPAKPLIRLSKPIRSAWHTSHIETNERPLIPEKGRLQSEFRPFQINTYRLLLK